MPFFKSKMPSVGDSIFSKMSALALQHGAVNLSQGFPNYDCSELLQNLVVEAVRSQKNQYAPMAGLPELRAQITQKTLSHYGVAYCPNDEITVTAGGTQAIFTAVAAVVHAQDEVIIIEPAYDSYEPAVLACGGKAVFVQLNPDTFEYDWAAVAAAITPRTKAIMLNSPHNPTGKMMDANDIFCLEKIVKDTNLVLISDEVYEHITFDGVPHLSFCQSEILRQHSFVISSFGKTYHTTGWKIGYCLAPAYFTQEFRKVHQFNVFSVNTPMQHALAEFLKQPEHYQNLPDFYAEKRNFFRDLMQKTPFELLPCSGTFFQMANYAAVSELNAMDFAHWLVREVGVAVVPISPFYKQKTEQKLVRFCFAKTPETLTRGVEKLRQYFG